MIHLDELVQVDRQHFKGDHEVFPEIELVQSTNNVLLILWIFLIQVLNKFGLHKTLFIESLLILQNLKSTVFSLLVIVTLKYNTETAFADFLDDFVSVSQMLIDLAEVFVRIGIKTVIGCLIENSNF